MSLTCQAITSGWRGVVSGSDGLPEEDGAATFSSGVYINGCWPIWVGTFLQPFFCGCGCICVCICVCNAYMTQDEVIIHVSEIVSFQAFKSMLFCTALIWLHFLHHFQVYICSIIITIRSGLPLVLNSARVYDYPLINKENKSLSSRHPGICELVYLNPSIPRWKWRLIFHIHSARGPASLLEPRPLGVGAIDVDFRPWPSS